MGKGIICKLWNVSATSKKGSRSQITDSISYIFDDKKTESKLTEESLEQFNAKQLGRECGYIENDIKTVEGAYIGVQNLASQDVAGAVKEMMDVKKFYGKMNGRAALHGVISLPEEESGKENAAKLMALCSDVMKKLFPNHQAVFAVHTNTENLHIHFIVNSVGLNGKKIHQPNNFVSSVLQPCINEYAKLYGFTPNSEWEKPKINKITDYATLKMELRKAVDIAIESSDSFEDFRTNLKRLGYKVNCGKYISLKNEDMTKAVRTYKLGNNYTKDAIVDRIMSRKLAFEHYKDSGDQLRATMTRSEKDIFSPTFNPLKKYRDMSPEERKRVSAQLKEGKNPWRMQAQRNWQMKEIAEELNMTVRVRDYINAYSADGTVESALQKILSLKKELAAEKKSMKEAMHKYKPIMDIYHRMQAIERMAYLYEHENREEYRGEYEEYRRLTVRLKNGYNKSFSDVGIFADSYDKQYKFINSQIEEFSKEYRELKKYAEAKGIIDVKADKGIWDMIGYDEVMRNAKKGSHTWVDTTYLVSPDNPDVTIRIYKNAEVNPGKDGYFQNISVSLLSKSGEILEQHDLHEGAAAVKAFASRLGNDYGLKNCESFRNITLAEEFSAGCRIEKNNKEKVKQDKLSVTMARSDTANTKKRRRDFKTYSFNQAVNCKTGIYVIVNSQNPTYMINVFSNEEGIRLKISDMKGRMQEECLIPPYKDRTNKGYGTLLAISRKYGFSDNMLVFDSIDEARNYSMPENIKNVK